MIISHRKKFIFFCNGKTGTHSITNALKGYDDNFRHPYLRKTAKFFMDSSFKNLYNLFSTKTINKIISKLNETKINFNKDFWIAYHTTPLVAKEVLDPSVWNSYFKFVFVRNPWDWVVSCYFWNNKDKIGVLEKLTEDCIYKLIDQLKQYKGREQDESAFQYQWATDLNDNFLVDFIGHYENLQSDFEKVCTRIGIKKSSLLQLNAMKHDSYMKYYTPKTFKLVAEIYKKDIEIFGYNANEI